MKVVLLEDVKKVGKKGEIVEVSDAYGRNVLIKKGLGLEGTAAEKAVLGALLTDGSSSGESVDLVISIVERDDFYRDTHRIIYDAILSLVKSNKTIDFITLSEELERRKKLDTVGGIAYITSLANEATGYNIEEHARIIVEKAQMRRLIDAGNKIVGMTYAGEDEPSVIMNKAEQLVLDVGGQTQSESTFSPIGGTLLKM